MTSLFVQRSASESTELALGSTELASGWKKIN